MQSARTNTSRDIHFKLFMNLISLVWGLYLLPGFNVCFIIISMGLTDWCESTQQPCSFVTNGDHELNEVPAISKAPTKRFLVCVVLSST